MGKEEMIKAIYEKIADKTLSFGCKVIPINIPYGKNDNFRIIHCRGDCYRIVYRRYFEGGHCEDFIDSNIKQIIGHPVMINTCIFNIYKYNNGDIKIIQELLNLWNNKLEPIENCGNDLCIDFIFNKLKEWQ